MASSGDEQFWHDNIVNSFKQFGYTPSDAEIAALLPASEGKGGYEAGQAAVANFVLAMQQLKGAQSLVQGNIQSETQGAQTAQQLGGQFAGQGAGSYQQALQALQKAPQLFGSMTPDQINQYLAPLQSQFSQGLGQVQGAAAQRGLAGSSLEAQAMAQAQQQFQQNVLSQGLGVGLNAQQQQAALLQGLGGQQFGLAGQQYGLAPQYLSLANQSAGQNVGLAEDMAQLPGQAANQAIAQNAAIQAMNPQSSSPWGSILGTALGAGVGAFGGPMGMALGANLGGQLGSAFSGNPAGAQVGSSLGNPLMIASLLGKGGMPGWSSVFGGGSAGGGAPGYTSGLAFPQSSMSGTSGLNAGLMTPGGYGQPGTSLLPSQLSLQ